MAKAKKKTPFEKLAGRDDVTHVFTFDSVGLPLESSFPDDRSTHVACAAAWELIYRCEQFVREKNRGHRFHRIFLRTLDKEVILHSHRDINLVYVRTVRTGAQTDEWDFEVPEAYVEESSEDEYGNKKKWCKKKTVKKKVEVKGEAKEEEAKPEEEK